MPRCSLRKTFARVVTMTALGAGLLSFSSASARAEDSITFINHTGAFVGSVRVAWQSAANGWDIPEEEWSPNLVPDGMHDGAYRSLPRGDTSDAMNCQAVVAYEYDGEDGPFYLEFDYCEDAVVELVGNDI